MTIQLQTIDDAIASAKVEIEKRDSLIKEAKEQILSGEQLGTPIQMWALLNYGKSYKLQTEFVQGLSDYLSHSIGQFVLVCERWSESIKSTSIHSNTPPFIHPELYKNITKTYVGILGPEGLQVVKQKTPEHEPDSVYRIQIQTNGEIYYEERHQDTGFMRDLPFELVKHALGPGEIPQFQSNVFRCLQACNWIYHFGEILPLVEESDNDIKFSPTSGPTYRNSLATTTHSRRTLRAVRIAAGNDVVLQELEKISGNSAILNANTLAEIYCTFRQPDTIRI